MLSSELTSSWLFLLAIIIAMTKITNSQIIVPQFPNDYVTQRLLKNLDSWNQNTREKNIIDPLTSDQMIQTGRAMTGIIPQTRRFLFSPTIQNTITNLNQNSNLQEVPISESMDLKSTYGHVNPNTGDMEKDVRTFRPRKICITFE